MKIEHLRIKNFRTLRDVEIRDIPNFCVFVGANGTGKKTLFNVFGFLREAFSSNVQTALIKQGGSRGVAEVRSRGSDGNIEIEIKFRAKKSGGKSPLMTYRLSVGEENGKAVVAEEILQCRQGTKGPPWRFIDFKNGKGTVVTNEGLETVKKETDLKREVQQLKESNILAIKGLAQFRNFPAAALGNLIEKWHLSDIHVSQARKEQEVGFADHLSREGENLSLVIEHLHKNHEQVLDEIITKLKSKVPGIEEVSTQTTADGRILLKVKDKSFEQPFLIRDVSDGTIKMLAYLVLLYDPAPHSLLCVEKPEIQLYPSLLEELAEEFRQYADRGEQVLVSTHSPGFLNAVQPDEVFWLIKKDGYTSIERASENKQVAAYMQSGSKMGYLWGEGFFAGVDPSG